MPVRLCFICVPIYRCLHGKHIGNFYRILNCALVATRNEAQAVGEEGAGLIAGSEYKVAGLG